MASQNKSGRSGGASGRKSEGRKDPQNPPKGKAKASPDGKNQKVQDVLSLVENLPAKDIPELLRGLANMGLAAPSATPGVPARSPNTLVPRVEPVVTPGASTEGSVIVVSKDTPGEGALKDNVADTSEQAPGAASGATRRTMFRKARKAVRDAEGNPSGTRSALRRLRHLAERFGTSLEDSLPENYELPTGVLESLEDESEGSDEDDEEEEEEKPVEAPPKPPSSPPATEPKDPISEAPKGDSSGSPSGGSPSKTPGASTAKPKAVGNSKKT